MYDGDQMLDVETGLHRTCMLYLCKTKWEIALSNKDNKLTTPQNLFKPKLGYSE